MENVSTEFQSVWKKIWESRLFLAQHEDDYYLISCTLCKKCEGTERELATRLQSAIERILESNHKLRRTYQGDAEEFQELYKKFLEQKPAYSPENIRSAKANLFQLLQETDLGETILKKREKFFEVEWLVVDAIVQL